ncbi:hypothetical protein JG687_00018234 [Phytophthora cactorum]|uniref:FAR1 domain-containing protein n=1 Tax=Phytophthora cactorum TaxID=29920 RepID=A0A8T1TNA0_9STRA|nr:hypothetical protein JG687_00018234 [Phytophthora cactorum]
MSATSTRKRAHVSDSDRGGSGEEAADSTVSVPAFEGEFSSWDAFHKEFKRHDWKFKPRDTGTRMNHNIRSIGCAAKLNAVLTKDEHDNYTVRVTKHRNVHNHNVDRGVYYSYAEARKVTSPGTRNVVKTLVQGMHVWCWKSHVNSSY